MDKIIDRQSGQVNSNILIVDDEPYIRDTLLDLFDLTSHNVNYATDGIDALEKLSIRSYDLAIIDLRMPRMDGKSLIHEIRKKNQDIAIIILTGHGELSEALKLLKEYQISDFLHKPIEQLPILLFSVENALEKQRLKRELNEYTAKLKKNKNLLYKKNIELERSVEEKKTLLREIHHRVKNNLMIVSTLLELQENYIEYPEIIKLFKASQERIKSMALIHEILYQSESFSKVEFSSYVKQLASNLLETYKLDAPITLNLSIDKFFLNVETASPCGLIINELVLNSVKYAFPENKPGQIEIIFFEDIDNQFALIVKDNGIGIPEKIDIRNTESLGLQLVCALVKQLDGTIELNRNKGTTFKFKFKKLREKK